ncbi:Membrane associated serine protease, rhomboid family [Desulfuromusa kysingii]|uniref:Membrane associated serine protease, rhomboid family n=1 Tax=Desulfuromusa kysingii TaxID=37625 RepID=A0A1H4BYT1_9BACT|nr:rhomboid family intramembrane serine protease [Desulfuromusa kysingii]SEA53227.1 Membrane associated serine protease, rhomboid family [Desulfuromusa kysingii]
MSGSYRRQQFFLKSSLQGNTLVQTLIYANLILFTLMVLHGTILGLGMQAIMNPPPRLLVHWGAQYWPLVLDHSEWWRCITYAFTHGGLIHVGFNMVVLYQVGPLLEAELGWHRLFTVYTFATIIATVAGLFWHPVTVVVGASGAIFGLIGFSISYYHRVGGGIGLQRRNFMLQWALMAFVFGIIVGADNAAHLGGAIAGAALGWFMPINIRDQRKTEKLFKTIAIVCVLITVVSIAFIPASWLIN